MATNRTTERQNQRTADHDILIELKTRMEDLKTDIKELKDGTAAKISDHETRINELESTKTRHTVMLSLGGVILLILAGLITTYMFR